MRLILLIFFVFLLFPDTFFSLPGETLDNSWMIALHLAYKNNFIFGKDIVFTYGPLAAILHYRYPIAISKYLYLAADVYFLFVAFSAFKIFMRRHFNWGPVIFIFLCLVTSLHMEVEQWYYFFFLFFLFLFIKEPDKMQYLVQAALLSLVGLYDKVNSGMVELVIFLLSIHYLLVLKKLSVRVYAAIMLSYLCGLLLSAWVLHTDLIGYIKGGFFFIKDYGDAMVLPLSFWAAGETGSAWGAILIFIFLLTGSVLVLFKLISKRKGFLEYADTIFIYAIVVLSAYTWYKSGFIRADEHVFHFFQMAGLLTLFLYIHTPAGLGKRAADICWWGILGTGFVIMSILPRSLSPASFFTGSRLFAIKMADARTYFEGYRAYDAARERSDRLKTLPNDFKTVIGEHTVDIFPMDIWLLYFNGLNYIPRPALQSYAAYDAYLDGLDNKKYDGPGGPDFVLLDYQAIDGRFAWMDESRAKLALLANYSLTGKIDDHLLLKRNNVPRTLTNFGREVVQVRMGEDIPVKKNDCFQFSQMFVRYDIKGRLQSSIFQPPGLKMTFTLENGQTKTVRAIKPVLADGIILNKFVDNQRELQLLMLSDGKMNADVRSVRIEPADSTGGFAQRIEMVNTYYIPDEKPEARRMADSALIGRLVDDYRPQDRLLQRPSDSEQDDFQLGIDGFADHNGMVRISGWAFRKKDDNRYNLIRAVARSEDNGSIYVVPSVTLAGRNYSSEHKRNDLDSCGFAAAIFKSQLPPGNYQIGIVIYNKRDGRSWVTYTDDYISESRLEKIALLPRASADTAYLKYNIESIDQQEDRFVISGWALMENADSAMNTTLILQSGAASFRVNIDLKKRPDLIARYKKPFFEYSGFYAAIPRSGLPKGTYAIGIEKFYGGSKGRSWVLTDKKLTQ